MIVYVGAHDNAWPKDDSLNLRIFGTERALPRGASLPRPAQVKIVFGEPVTFKVPEALKGEELKAFYLEIGQEIMRRIAALQPQD